ncbi:hypothetical protein NP493_1045g00033 [Ridgeia piscesae]|uniref:B box-type domain-containing protein n=1 Tax=Ridgeia piscesae TaxID=27915 RepID=A0AAD9KJE2_RIDPI|nr:hypothetical protein NP493_1045g00033 [Ridgeia piscesae]
MCLRACVLACLRTCVHACVDLYRYEGLPPTNELTAVLRQVHIENERVNFCLTCHTVTCTSCVIDEHDGHNVAEANTLYKQNMNDVRDLLRNLDGEVKRQRDVKANIGTRREQIAQSYQQIEDTVKEKATKMILSIKKQEEHILSIVHQKRDQELERLLEKLDDVECYLTNAQRFNVSQLLYC